MMGCIMLCDWGEARNYEAEYIVSWRLLREQIPLVTGQPLPEGAAGATLLCLWGGAEVIALTSGPLLPIGPTELHLLLSSPE